MSDRNIENHPNILGSMWNVNKACFDCEALNLMTIISTGLIEREEIEVDHFECVVGVVNLMCASVMDKCVAVNNLGLNVYLAKHDPNTGEVK